MNIEFFVLKVEKKYTKDYFDFLNNQKYFKEYNLSSIKYKRVKSFGNFKKIWLIRKDNELNLNIEDLVNFFKENKFNINIEDLEVIEIPNNIIINSKKKFDEINNIWPCYLKYKKIKEYFNNFNLKEDNINFLKSQLDELEVQSKKFNDINYCLIFENLDKKDILVKHFDSDNIDNISINHCFINAINEFCLKKFKNSKKCYLLSGKVVVSLYEPCLMCSMALSLSRIDLLVYKYKNKKFESLTSTKLLETPINHKYQVINNLFN